MSNYRISGLTRMSRRLSDEIDYLIKKLSVAQDELAHNKANIQEAIADLTWSAIALRRARSFLEKCKKN